MPKILRLTPQAEREATEARQWYEERNESAAQRFVEELRLGFARISEVPERFSYFREPFRQYILQKFPYVLIYREKDDVVEVIAVAHAKRRPGYWDESNG